MTFEELLNKIIKYGSSDQNEVDLALSEIKNYYDSTQSMISTLNETNSNLTNQVHQLSLSRVTFTNDTEDILTEEEQEEKEYDEALNKLMGNMEEK